MKELRERLLKTAGTGEVPAVTKPEKRRGLACPKCHVPRVMVAAIPRSPP